MTSTILLDLDGPILDGRLRHYKCYSDILAMYGYPAMPSEKYWNMKRARKSRAEQLRVTGAISIYDEFLHDWLARIENPNYLQLDRVQRGALGKLREWKNNGLAVLLVTMRHNRAALNSQLDRLSISPGLSDIVVCEHAHGGVGKGERLVSEYPEVDPNTTLWIGDTEADSEGARFVGCPVWLVSNGLRHRSLLESLKPDRLLASISEANIAAS